MANKKKLREVLFEISTPNERGEYLKLEKLDEVSAVSQEIKKKMDNDTSNESILLALKDLSHQVSKIKFVPTDHSSVVDAIEKMTEKLATSGKSPDFSGFFKDLGVQLAQTGKSSKSTEELIKNLKWNSSMTIRNRSGSPISPAISPFYINDYDDIKLSSYDANGNPGAINYYFGGGLIATLTLTYDGSGNLTEAKRTA